jgi:arylsulfatase A-like enzyme
MPSTPRGLALVLLCLACITETTRAADATRPNVILILADDLGWGDLHCYGNTQAKTPHLDRMARQGTLFTQFYVNASVCSPSRVAFMTGQFPGRLGVHTVISGAQRNAENGVPNWLDPNLPLVTKLLKDSGYATAHFGKWHLGSNHRDTPSPSAYGIDDHRTTTTVRGAPTWDETGWESRATSTTRIMDETIRFVTEHKEGPFYVNVWTQLTHAVIAPSPEQLAVYDNLRLEAGLPFTSPKQIFLAAVTDVDTQVGRLLKTLAELGLDENTLVAFSSDNGPEDIESRAASHSGVGSSGPFRGRKRSLYDGGVRVPFIVRWPGHVPAGRVEGVPAGGGLDS